MRSPAENTWLCNTNKYILFAAILPSILQISNNINKKYWPLLFPSWKYLEKLFPWLVTCNLVNNISATSTAPPTGLGKNCRTLVACPAPSQNVTGPRFRGRIPDQPGFASTKVATAPSWSDAAGRDNNQYIITYKHHHLNFCFKTKHSCSCMLDLWFAACATPEKRRPAVPFRKQLCGCRDAESAPSVWINVYPVRWPDFINAAEVREHAEWKQRRRPEPRVQIPAWISSGCWAP